MKVWNPLVVSIIIAIVINVFPLFMAFVLGSEQWKQSGWAFYFFTIPLGGILILFGFIISLILYFIKK